MKQFFFIAALMLSLASCTKKDQVDISNLSDPPVDKYFSRVKKYLDGRGATDTVYTVHLVTKAMEEQFQQNCGYVYEETNTYIDLGICWSRKK